MVIVTPVALHVGCLIEAEKFFCKMLFIEDGLFVILGLISLQLYENYALDFQLGRIRPEKVY